MNYLNLIKHLLPNGRAWKLTIDKQLRQFFDSFTQLISDIRDEFDLSYLDLFPQTTRLLSKWEQQWALPDATLTEQERRDRLAGRWKALGGQSPRYIQDTLRAAGFDVYVYDWWTTPPAIGDHTCSTPLDPSAYLTDSYAGGGYSLAGKTTTAVSSEFIACGQAQSQCGEPVAQCGAFLSYAFVTVEYPIPTDPQLWPYFFYIGADPFGTLANIPAARRDEFENLVLKLRPAHMWVGLLVTYV